MQQFDESHGTTDNPENFQHDGRTIRHTHPPYVYPPAGGKFIMLFITMSDVTRFTISAGLSPPQLPVRVMLWMTSSHDTQKRFFTVIVNEHDGSGEYVIVCVVNGTPGQFSSQDYMLILYVV